MNEERIYWRVGLFVCLALMAAATLWWLTGPGQLSSGHPLKIQYSYTGPIKAGAFVRLSGLSVGRVQQVRFIGKAEKPQGAMVEVEVNIQPEAFDVLTDASRFYVTTMGVLGEYYVDVEPRKGQRQLQPGETVRGVDLPRSDLLLARAAGFMEVMDTLLVDNRKELVDAISKMTQLVKEGHALLDDPEGNNLIQKINQVLGSGQKVVDALAVALGDGKSTQETLKTLPVVLKKIRSWENEKGQELGEILTEIRVTLKRADALWHAMDDSELQMPQGAAKLASQTQKTLKRLEQVSQRADKMLKSLEKQEGAAGQLWYDKSFAQDLKDLVKVLRHNPKSLLFK